MADFDPRAYLAKKAPPTQPAFDPDAYVAQAAKTRLRRRALLAPSDEFLAELQRDPDALEKRVKASEQGLTTTGTEAAVYGGGQGLSMGWLDELAAGVDAALPGMSPAAIRPTLKGKASLGDRYRTARDFYRARNAVAAEDHPSSYTTAEVAGAVLPALAPAGRGAQAAKATQLTRGERLLKAAKATGLMAGQGALQGAGYSDASAPADVARDSAIGAGVRVAGGAIGAGLGRLGAKTAEGGRALVSRGTERAAQQAEQEVADQLATAAGKVGGEVQKGSRFVENLLRLEQSGSLTAAQKSELAALRASGVIPKLEQSVAQSTLNQLPGQAGTIAARQAELAALQQGAARATQDRASQLLTPQVGVDIKSFLKSYAEPLIWAYLGNKAAEAAGASPEQRTIAAGAAGLIGGRTRAGKALWNRVNRPAHQVALGRFMERAGRAEQSKLGLLVRQLFARGIPATATAAAAAAPTDNQ